MGSSKKAKLVRAQRTLIAGHGGCGEEHQQLLVHKWKQMQVCSALLLNPYAFPVERPCCNQSLETVLRPVHKEVTEGRGEGSIFVGSLGGFRSHTGWRCLVW